MKKECKKVEIKKWGIGPTEVIFDGIWLSITVKGGMDFIRFNKSDTRKLYQKLSSLYKD